MIWLTDWLTDEPAAGTRANRQTDRQTVRHAREPEATTQTPTQQESRPIAADAFTLNPAAASGAVGSTTPTAEWGKSRHSEATRLLPSGRRLRPRARRKRLLERAWGSESRREKNKHRSSMSGRDFPRHAATFARLGSAGVVVVCVCERSSATTAGDCMQSCRRRTLWSHVGTQRPSRVASAPSQPASQPAAESLVRPQWNGKELNGMEWN